MSRVGVNEKDAAQERGPENQGDAAQNPQFVNVVEGVKPAEGKRNLWDKIYDASQIEVFKEMGKTLDKMSPLKKALVYATAPVSLPFLFGYKLKGIVEPFLINGSINKMKVEGHLGPDRKEKLPQDAAGLWNFLQGGAMAFGAAKFLLVPAIYTWATATFVITPVVAPMLVIGAIGGAIGLGVAKAGVEMIRGKDPHNNELKKESKNRSGIIKPAGPPLKRKKGNEFGPGSQITKQFAPVSGVTKDEKGNPVRKPEEEVARPMKRIVVDPSQEPGMENTAGAKKPNTGNSNNAGAAAP